MGTFVSPGVYSSERDISEIVPSIATTTAALVGYSKKGNVDAIQLITNKQQFLDEYGKPVNTSGNYFHYTALAFLEQGNALWCKRVHLLAQYGGYGVATTSGTNESFSDLSNDFDTILGSDYDGSLDNDDLLFMILGKDPGVWNSKISIAIDTLVNNEESWDETAPSGTPDTITPAIVDQYTFRIKVYYENDDGNDELVETWIVSRKHKIDGYGRQLYLESKINGISKYITVQDNTALADTLMPDGVAQSASTNLGAGNDGTAYSSSAYASAIVTGWGFFDNPDDVDIRILLNGGETTAVVQTKMKELAEARADCMAILDVDYDSMAASVATVVDWRKDTININSSYCTLYAPWVRINDPYNDVLIYVPPSGYVGAQFAYNDNVAYPWNAPAGFNRGLLNIIGMQTIFTQGERDTLYAAQINPLQTFRGEGDVIWGQKTLQVKSSALDRVNVRRLLIVIEKSVSISLRPFVFENNSELTRFRINAMLIEYLDILSSQGAFQTEAGDNGYQVVVNPTNNTPGIIDRNELHVDIFIKPARTAEFIKLQTIVTSSGASFTELISRGANL